MQTLTWMGPVMRSGSLVLFLILVGQNILRSEDWPQWRGPNRNGISAEQGWKTQWPANGPARLWKAKVGVGYSSCSVSQGRLYTMGNTDDVDHVFCLDAESGQQLWKHSYPCPAKDPNGYHGTRVTPTVDGTRVYSVSRHGHLFCLDAVKGQVIWSKDFKKDFNAKPPRWGYSGSPLIEKNWLLIEIGGKGQSVVAFDKTNGKVIWKNGNDDVAYSSLVAFNHGRERSLAVFCKDNIVGRSMKDGRELWRSYWKTSYGVNAATPIIDGNKVFVSSGYNSGCTLLALTANRATEVWRNKSMRNHVNSCVLWKGYLYGFDENQLKCMDFKTGDVIWNTRRFGKGSLMLADEKLILYSDRGLLAVAAVNPKEYQEISSVQVLGGRATWAMPVLANGRIYCRSLEDLVALDVKGP
jgi:outer membrane protein assembly factor BamB